MILKTLNNAFKLFALIVITVLCLSAGACTLISYKNDAAYERVEVGETEAAVIAAFRGLPSERDRRGTTYGRYTSTVCTGSCYERLWYENRLSLVDEAWFIEVDNNRRVVAKGKISSP